MFLLSETIRYLSYISKVWGNHSQLPSNCDVMWKMSGKDSEQIPEHTEEDQQEDCDYDDPELKAIRMRVREMEEETERLKGLTGDDTVPVGSSKAGTLHPLSVEEKREADKRSVYVGNVDYGGTAKDLEGHFSNCGSINRITILCDKFSGHPKGYAYIEFAEKSSVEAAIAMDETVFRGRTIKVLPKRTNMPGISTTDRGGFRGRPRGHRGNIQRGHRPRGRPYRGRGRTGQWNKPG
ncbi:embryonic polyadenylate-binding protein 2 isoform X2 [Engystomops pustulosus]|uniref:embryonic polyadenylate-binding protein 2 isoform X2 n=1 Tax=Engystomops pustulosus TaxID=76066 RepID=UPI003AFAA181